MIIGIAGNKQHGKDTVAAYIARKYGFYHTSLAATMKLACEVIFGWDEEWTRGNKKDTVDPRWGITPRQALQLLGTEYGQQLLCTIPEFKEKTGRCLWVNSLLEKIPDEANAVISDVRFIHEVEKIRERGGKIIRVYRKSVPVDYSHPSESEVPDIHPDCTILNDGDIDLLQRKVDVVMKSIIHLETECGRDIA